MAKRVIKVVFHQQEADSLTGLPVIQPAGGHGCAIRPDGIRVGIQSGDPTRCSGFVMDPQMERSCGA